MTVFIEMKELAFKESKELSQGQRQVLNPGLTPEPAPHYHTLGVLGSLCATLSVPSSQSITAYDRGMFLYSSFVQNPNPSLPPFIFSWTPWSLNKMQAFAVKYCPLESSQAAGLMQLMAPNCCPICSHPPSFSAVLT